MKVLRPLYSSGKSRPPPPPYRLDRRLGGPHWMSPKEINSQPRQESNPAIQFTTHHNNILTLDVHLLLDIHLLQINIYYFNTSTYINIILPTYFIKYMGLQCEKMFKYKVFFF
jgi:hypothetical protein